MLLSKTANMKKLLTIAILIFLIASSCKKALEIEVFDFKDPENFYKTDKDLLQGVNGVYKNLMTWDMWISPAWYSVLGEDDDLLLDNWLAGGYTGNQRGEWYIQRPWKGYYYAVQRANLVLKYAAQVTGDAAMIDRIKAEALFIRGFCYFEIVRRYGAAPIRTEAYTPEQSKNIARSPVVDVYKQAEADLKAAAAVLPENYTGGKYTTADRGRPTKAAALGLLAKVYMHMAGDELKQTNYYTEAITAAKAVRDMAKASGYPKLEMNYMKNFNEAEQDNSDEILFAIPATHSPNQGSELPGYFSPQGRYSGGGSGGYVSMRIDLFSKFEPNDNRVAFGTAIWDSWKNNANEDYYYVSRLPAGAVFKSGGTWGSEYGGGAGYGQDTYTFGGKDIFASPRLYSKKYTDPNAQAKDENGNNPIIIRYADVLLLLAEAENEVNGPTGLAYDAADEVRVRANLLPWTRNLSKEDFRQRIRDERRKELYGEFQRRWDLIRWGIWIPTMKAAGRDRLEFQKLYPIAQEEIAGNKEITVNNPGY